MGKTVRLPNGVIVRGIRVVSTNLLVFTAYEPSSIMGKHHTITYFDKKVYGDIGSRLDGKREENIQEALEYIFTAFPFLRETNYTVYGGSVEIDADDELAATFG